MKISTPNGTTNFDDDCMPSNDDKNDILSAAVTAHFDASDSKRGIDRSSSDELQNERAQHESAAFQALCDASTNWPADLSVCEFLRRASDWLNGLR